MADLPIKEKRTAALINCAVCSASVKKCGNRQFRCKDCTRKRNLAEIRAKNAVKAALRPPRPVVCERCPSSFPFRARKRFCDQCKPAQRAEASLARSRKSPEKRRAIAKRHVERNREKVLKRRALERIKNREKNLQYFRSQHRRDMVNKWEKERRAANHGYDISKRISHGIRLAIKASKAGRRWEQLVGYSLNELTLHLERQFLPGMKWENRCDWHIDHIVPLSSFDFKTPECEGFKAAWAITNLRPLWSIDNMSKGDKRIFLI